jgi:hypothetical protein
LSERVSVWLRVRDPIPDAVLSPRVVVDRQDAILVTGDGPVGSRVFIKIGGVDRKCSVAKQLRSKRGQAAGLEQGNQILNFPKEGTCSEGIAHPMKTCGQLGVRRSKKVLTRPVVDNALSEHEARVRQFSRHAAAQRITASAASAERSEVIVRCKPKLASTSQPTSDPAQDIQTAVRNHDTPMRHSSPSRRK